MAEQAARRSTRVVRRASMGQTLIIFALTFTVLIGFVGLAIDSIRVYDLYARMQRAAEAGALAGVIYMPNFYTSDLPSSPNDNAVCQAQQLAYKNSFGPAPCINSTSPNMPATPCPAVKSSVEVAVCKTSQPYQLQVFVTEPINVLFLGALGIGPLTITASATAAYNPPLALAVDPTVPSTTGTLGNTCNGVSCGGRPWGLNINGPAELKEQGDPFVTCAGGNSDSQALDPSAETNVTYTGWTSNMPLYAQTLGVAPTTCTAALATPLASQSAYQNANPDITMQPFQGAIYNDGTNNPPTHQGYSFYVNVATANSTLNVYNAPFNPGAPSSCNGRIFVGQSDSFFPCPSNKSPYTVYPGTGDLTPNFDDPKMYFTVTYSVYKLNSGPLSPGDTTYVGSFTALPY
ncbi:MAG: TadE/TadG family type IV pilus assembly protein, partial [Ktedonobacterales bacterium]